MNMHILDSSLRRRLSSAALAVLLITLGFSAPEAQTRTDANAIPRLEFQKYALPNGLEVILHRDRRPGAPVSRTCSST